MKKNYLKLISSVLLIFLFLTGCKKEMLDYPVTSESKLLSMSAPNVHKNECQLTYAIDWNSNPNWFHYNDKGLADEWRIDFGSGIPDIFTMTYDNKNQLSHAEWHFDGALNATIEFVWTGNHITNENWNQGGFLFDVVNTYDQKGQLVKREISYGFRAEIEYSPDGNPISYFAYFADELFISDILTYNQPNKNPFLAIQGIPYGFPYVAYVFGKRHETSDIFTDYSSGTPIVGLDNDPAQTVMELTHQRYLSSVTFFDRASESFKTRNFEYQNCGPANNATTRESNPLSATNLSGDKKSTKRSPLLLGKPDDKRMQIEELRKHLNKR
jgi:hypothetical protein